MKIPPQVIVGCGYLTDVIISTPKRSRFWCNSRRVAEDANFRKWLHHGARGRVVVLNEGSKRVKVAYSGVPLFLTNCLWWAASEL